MPRPSTRYSSGTPRPRGPRPQRPNHRPGVAPVLDRPHGRPHHRSRRRTPRRGRYARRTGGEAGTVRASCIRFRRQRTHAEVQSPTLRSSQDTSPLRIPGQRLVAIADRRFEIESDLIRDFRATVELGAQRVPGEAISCRPRRRTAPSPCTRESSPPEPRGRCPARARGTPAPTARPWRAPGRSCESSGSETASPSGTAA